LIWPLLRAALFTLEPEAAHTAAMRALDAVRGTPLLRLLGTRADGPVSEAFGARLPNPIGLAAGFDKNGEHIDTLAALGFGFLEIGTVTPRPQPGNPKPRLFRLPRAGALINRMGFNNGGVDRLVENVQRSRYRGVLGINIGRNFDTPNERAADDYVACLEKVYPLATYVTVNISSPNTRDLRALQQGAGFDALLGAICARRTELAARHGRHVPLAVKLAPDLEPPDLEAIAEKLVGFGIEAVIACNTTISRAGVEGLPHAEENGGMSGRPLFERALRAVGVLARALDGRALLIAAGGISGAADARAMRDAGASLLQVYTALIYRGPALISELAGALQSAPSPALRPEAARHA